MMETAKLGPPSNSKEFDEAYSSLSHFAWSDIRIPKELKELITIHVPHTSLELGCGLGRFSSYVAEQGVKAVGVDFSAIAIEKAKNKVLDKENKPTFLVGDVTKLDNITGKFDVAFDVGCFHCLDEEGQKMYIDQIYKLLKPGATILLWALDNSPSNIKLSPDYISDVFGSRFDLIRSKRSYRRVMFVASHWYWLVAR